MPVYESDTRTNGQTVVEMISGVVAGARDLTRAHAAQLQAEVQVEVRRATTAAILLATGAALAILGLPFILVTIAVVLRDAAGWPPWAAWLLVGGGVIVIGAILAVIGWQRWKEVHLIPTHSLHSMRESLTWITRAQS